MTEEQVSERTRVEKGQIVMPFYIICDVSGSMTSDMPTLNDGLRRLHGSIVAEPEVDDVAQLCVMTFSDDAQVVLPMAQMSSGQQMPTLTVHGGTNYGAAFRELARAIERDAAELKRQGYQVFRPCAFFLSDGEPLDHDWFQTFTSTLTYNRQTGQGMRRHPIFVPFGFRDAREDDLRRLAYPPEKGKWYHSKSHQIEETLKGMLGIIMKTVITAGKTPATGQPSMPLQQPPANSGITQGDSDYDPDWVS
jgi:uncharacterized protein YegL